MALHFLVLDDDLNMANALKLSFEIAYPDAKVYIATTNKEAFQALESFTPNLITTDIVHPGGDGYDFLTKIRADPKTKFIPVIAISGQSQREEEELRQYRYGFNAVLPKPISLPGFVKCINRVLPVITHPDLLLLRLGCERPELDYKEIVDLKNRDRRAGLAKDVIAMANWGGGTIIIGVSESRPGEFVPVGVPNELLEQFETTRLNQALREFLDPPVSVTSRRVRDGQQVFIFLEVPPATTSLILAAKQNDRTGLYLGRIYSRTSAAESAEIQKSSELRYLLERLQGHNSA
jgi:CheY-like chemotaxis protein